MTKPTIAASLAPVNPAMRCFSGCSGEMPWSWAHLLVATIWTETPWSRLQTAWSLTPLLAARSSAVEESVKQKVHALTDRFPIYG